MVNEKTEDEKTNIGLDLDELNGKLGAKSRVPDGGYGWVVCFSCWFGNFSGVGPVLAYGIILPSLTEYYKEGVFIISLVGSVLSSMGFALGPIAAMMTNKLGLRAVYMLGAFIFGTFCMKEACHSLNNHQIWMSKNNSLVPDLIFPCFAINTNSCSRFAHINLALKNLHDVF